MIKKFKMFESNNSINLKVVDMEVVDIVTAYNDKLKQITVLVDYLSDKEFKDHTINDGSDVSETIKYILCNYINIEISYYLIIDMLCARSRYDIIIYICDNIEIDINDEVFGEMLDMLLYLDDSNELDDDQLELLLYFIKNPKFDITYNNMNILDVALYVANYDIIKLLMSDKRIDINQITSNKLIHIIRLERYDILDLILPTLSYISSDCKNRFFKIVSHLNSEHCSKIIKSMVSFDFSYDNNTLLKIMIKFSRFIMIKELLKRNEVIKNIDNETRLDLIKYNLLPSYKGRKINRNL